MNTVTRYIAHIKQPGIVVHIVVHRDAVKMTVDGLEVFNVTQIAHNFTNAALGCYIGYITIPQINDDVLKAFITTPCANPNMKQQGWIHMVTFSAFDYVPLGNYVSGKSPIIYKERYKLLQEKIPMRNKVKLLLGHKTAYETLGDELEYVPENNLWEK